ncbi:MAG: hypothetical protein IPH69_04425 [Bacteroidales bacterium]|nr:hypothetical protein [Bacteroidales bacterium]MBK7625861.1 hypothetical protein [Bacteroidales bacterium]
MRSVLVITGIILISVMPLFSQEKQQVIVLNGYVTTMQSAMFDSLSGPVVYDNLIHNRLNFKGYINSHLTFAAEFRNRLFTGDMVRTNSSYSEMIGMDQGFTDMSWNVINENSFLLNTTVDRLWFDINAGKAQLRIGRQRINWGQTLVWNPNDVFNAYSFFDFDYAERPGSDAVRFQYFPTYSSAVELAVKVNYDNAITAAGLYRFNKWGYDIQFLAGWVNSEDIVLGAGWSGSIGSVSFRGEGSWFEPVEDFPVTEGTLLLTAGVDKIFKNNSMAQAQIMYCNNPLSLTDFNSFYTGNLSSKDLAFSRFSAFGQFTWAATPLLNTSISAMWFPDLKGYFAGPSLDLSLAENVDFSLIWQHFTSIMDGTKTRINLGFLRIKYSF